MLLECLFTSCLSYLKLEKDMFEYNVSTHGLREDENDFLVQLCRATGKLLRVCLTHFSNL